MTQYLLSKGRFFSLLILVGAVKFTLGRHICQLIQNFNIPLPRHLNFLRLKFPLHTSPIQTPPKEKMFCRLWIRKTNFALFYYSIHGLIYGECFGCWRVCWAICTNDNILCNKQGSEYWVMVLKKFKFIHLGFESPCRNIRHSLTKYVFLPLRSSILLWERLRLPNYLVRHGMVKKR